MGFAYSFNADTGIVRIVGEGDVSLADRAVLVQTLLDDRELPERAALLIAVSKVTNAPTAEEASVIGILINRLQTRFQRRVAIVNVVVGHVTVSHLVAFSTDSRFPEVMVFGSEVEATSWLISGR